MKYTMDEIDVKLLELLQDNGRMPLKQMAAEVFLSSPAVSARIARLEGAGIIKGYRAVVDPIALGHHITAFINLEVPPTEKGDFGAFITKCPHVLECNGVTGTYSMLMKVAFPSTASLDAFVGQLQKYGHTQTQIVFSAVVESRGIPPAAAMESEPQ